MKGYNYTIHSFKKPKVQKNHILRNLGLNFLFILFLTSIKFTYAQKVTAYFLNDSIKIGVPTKLVLKCEHDNTKDLVFPDKKSNFKPFFFLESNNFNTSKKNGIYIDSVIYDLQTFSVDSLIFLSLYLSDFKTNELFYSNKASIRLHSLLNEKDINEHKLKPTLNFYEVPLDINYPKFFYYALAIGLFLYLTWIFLGKFFIRAIKLYFFRNKNKVYQQEQRKARNKNNITSYKIVLSTWKNHMQWLCQKPIASMSSKEINDEFGNPRLNEALTYIDAAVFGGQTSHNIEVAFDVLKDFSSEKFKTQYKLYKSKLNGESSNNFRGRQFRQTSPRHTN